MDARRKGDDSREEGKKRGGSPGENEGGDKGRLRRGEKEKERVREPSPGPKAAKKPLKKTA